MLSGNRESDLSLTGLASSVAWFDAESSTRAQSFPGLFAGSMPWDKAIPT